MAGLDCGDGIRQWGIYVLDFSGACSSAASDLEAGNPDIPLVKHLSWSPGGKLAIALLEIEKPDGPAIRTSGPPSWRTATLPSSAGLSPNAAVWSP